MHINNQLIEYQCNKVFLMEGTTYTYSTKLI